MAVMFMALSNKFIEILVNQIKNDLIDVHINKLTMLNDSDFLISKSKKCRQKLFISLNNREPFITLCEEERTFSSKSNNFLISLKKELEDARILDVYKSPNDRIVVIKISNTSDAYVKYYRTLYIELIPNQTNLILCNEADIIVSCFKTTPLESERFINKGAQYVLPNHINNSNLSQFEEQKLSQFPSQTYESLYNDEGIYSVIKTNTSKDITLNDIYNNYLDTMEKNHREDLSFEVTNTVKRHIKSLNKKLISLESELKSTAKMEDFKLYGELLLTYQNTFAYPCNDVELCGYKIPLDPSIKISDNANKYFAKYHKMKRSVAHLNEQIEITKEKIQYFMLLDNQLKSSNDADLKGIEFELIENGYITKKILKKQSRQSQGMSQPYYYYVDNVKIGFGKNNFQNNYLTFTLAKPDFIFMHVKDRPGSHVIIFDANPSNHVLETAASIALINAKLDDGEVQMTAKKNVKKINSVGMVSLSTYQSVYIKQINPKLREQIKTLRKN